MNFQKAACVSLLTLTLALGACNGSFRPASQAPRTYISAHDTVNGECRSEINQAHTTKMTNHHDGRFTVEDTLPMNGHFVRCVNEQTTNPKPETVKY